MKIHHPHIILPAEWSEQSGVQLTWPHQDTDWMDSLDEVIPCFVSLAHEIVKREKLIIVCSNQSEVRKQLGVIDESKIIFREIKTNDTWARDHGGITLYIDQKPFICDFAFNGWGLKFPFHWDNQITQQLYVSGTFAPYVGYLQMKHFVLEEGSIESDGCGTLMTTTRCLLSDNRNENRTKEEISLFFQLNLGIQRILWLNHGYLSGDDTDGHVDTIARFCNRDTIAYVKCEDQEDEHYQELALMEKEIQSFRTVEGQPYRLIPLPMADQVMYNGHRLPATYANFLIINGAVLIPFYQSPKDLEAKEQLQKVFPEREIIGINSLPFIKQHGSIHCLTMQFPKGVF